MTSTGRRKTSEPELQNITISARVSRCIGHQEWANGNYSPHTTLWYVRDTDKVWLAVWPGGYRRASRYEVLTCVRRMKNESTNNNTTSVSSSKISREV